MAKLQLRSYLAIMVLLAVAPALVVTGVAVSWVSASYKDASDTRLTEMVRTLAHSIENELDDNVKRLSTAAAFAAAPADGVLAPELQHSIGFQPDSVVRIDTWPPAEPPSMYPPAIAEQAFASGAPTLSNLYQEPTRAEPRVAVAMPYAAGGAVRIVTLILPPQRLFTTAQQERADADSLLVAITDGTGRLVARSRNPQQYVGRQVPNWGRLEEQGTDRGLFEAQTAEGAQVKFAFQRLRGTPGWVVVVGEPLAVFNARWLRPLGQLAVGAAGACVIAVLMAGWLSRRILRPVAELEKRAAAVARDSGVAALAGDEHSGFPIAEFDALRHNIEVAGWALLRRAESERLVAAALRASEVRYRTLAETGALAIWSADPTGERVIATGWERMTGKAENLRDSWLQCVHPEDISTIYEQWAQAQGSRQPLDIEYRVAMRDGDYRWIRSRGAPVLGGGGAIVEWVGVLEDINDRRRAQSRIAHLALHDALTGLPNRARFLEQLTATVQRAARGRLSALLYVDLDHFKDVNDSLGHPVGDALLRAACQRLSTLIRDTDLAARLGGDEFAIIQGDLARPDDAAELAERVVAALAEPFDIEQHTVRIGASIGIAIADAAAGSVEALMQQADLALYQAKQNGRGCFYFYEAAMGARVRQRQRAEAQLREALANGALGLAYRPLVAMPGGDVCGFTARLLLAGADAAPALTLVEDVGLLFDVAEWMLRRACGDAAHWPEQRKVGLHIAYAQLHHAAFPQAVAQALAAAGLAPVRLELEIDESTLFKRADDTLRVLQQLKAQGLRISVGNFGMGSSMLTSMRHFPIDKVRMNSQFIQQIGREDGAEAIVRAVARLCATLGIQTLADGVSHRAQLDVINEEGCTEAQGDWFTATGQPVESDAPWHEA